MARLSRFSRYRSVGLTRYRIYESEEADLSADPVRTDRVIARRYTTWREIETGSSLTTEQGETVERIANRVFGDPERWWLLCDFNEAAVFDPFELPKNTELHVPPADFVGRMDSQL